MAFNVSPLERSIFLFRDAQYEYAQAETARQQAWQAYIDARNAAEDIAQRVEDLKRDVVSEARALSASEPAPRTNRDARRAQVEDGLYAQASPSHHHVNGYADDYDDGDIPF